MTSPSSIKTNSLTHATFSSSLMLSLLPVLSHMGTRVVEFFQKPLQASASVFKIDPYCNHRSPSGDTNGLKNPFLFTLIALNPDLSSCRFNALHFILLLHHLAHTPDSTVLSAFFCLLHCSEFTTPSAKFDPHSPSLHVISEDHLVYIHTHAIPTKLAIRFPWSTYHAPNLIWVACTSNLKMSLLPTPWSSHNLVKWQSIIVSFPIKPGSNWSSLNSSICTFCTQLPLTSDSYSTSTNNHIHLIDVVVLAEPSIENTLQMISLT